MSPADFDRKIEDGAFIEYEEVYPDLYYGTLRSELESGTSDAPVLLDIDVKGALNVKEQYEDAAYVVFIKAPSLDELQKRLAGRATESGHSFKARIDRAVEESKFENRFDHVVVNDDLESAVDETIRQVNAFLSALN